MKILLIHNYYQNSGGEDAVVANEKLLLLENGHDVKLYSDDNHRIKSSWDKLRTAIALTGSKQSHKKLTRVVKDFKPDIIHAHNLFPLVTASAYDVAIENSVPIVQTLHNYRIVCASSLLLKDGKPCELCISQSPYNAVRHRCYRGSVMGSFAVAHMVDKLKRLDVWGQKVDQFIALTEFAKSKLVEANIPENKITIKPNFTIRQQDRDNEKSRVGVLYVGRLSAEKGIETLIDAWLKVGSETLPKLKIIGDGPLLNSIKEKCRDNKNIEILGQQAELVVNQEMAKAMCLVFPSVCYEGFPMAIVEALANGLPVVCTNLGSMASIIEDGKTGLRFEPNNPDDLIQKLNHLIEDQNRWRIMSQNCEDAYLNKYTPEKNYLELMSIYTNSISNYEFKN